MTTKKISPVSILSGGNTGNVFNDKIKPITVNSSILSDNNNTCHLNPHPDIKADVSCIWDTKLAVQMALGFPDYINELESNAGNSFPVTPAKLPEKIQELQQLQQLPHSSDTINSNKINTKIPPLAVPLITSDQLQIK